MNPSVNANDRSKTATTQPCIFFFFNWSRNYLMFGYISLYIGFVSVIFIHRWISSILFSFSLEECQWRLFCVDRSFRQSSSILFLIAISTTVYSYPICYSPGWYRRKRERVSEQNGIKRKTLCFDLLGGYLLSFLCVCYFFKRICRFRIKIYIYWIHTKADYSSDTLCMYNRRNTDVDWI